MQRGFRIFCIVLAVILAIYFTWASSGRQSPEKNIQLHIDSVYVINTDSGKGNIVGINPYMTPTDYATEQHFYDKLDAYLQSALQRGWIKEKTIILFPEYIATWLVIEGEKNSIYKSPTVTRALTTFVTSNFFSYMKSWFTAPDGLEDKVKYSIFASKGQSVARMYVSVFSQLARKYKVTIIGGSVLLPNPVVSKNRISIRKGPLYNITAVFNPDGSLQPSLVKKAFPVAEELPFITQCPPSEIPVFDLPVGKTAVFICADSWYPEAYEAVKANQPKLIAVPSYTQKDKAMQEPWTGYSGFNFPGDADSTDVGRITLGEAWMKYTIPGRIRSTGADYGLNVSLRGKMWDLGSDGEIIAINEGESFLGSAVKGASMICMWLR